MSGNLSEVCALRRFTGGLAPPSETRRHRTIPWSWKTFMEEANGPATHYDDRDCFGTSDRKRSNGSGAGLWPALRACDANRARAVLESGPPDTGATGPTATSGSTPPLLPFRCQTVTGTTRPQSLERGQRSSRAVAEMYIKGVSTRQDVMREFGSLSSSQVSRTTKLLDEELAAQPAPDELPDPGCALRKSPP